MKYLYSFFEGKLINWVGILSTQLIDLDPMREIDSNDLDRGGGGT